MPQQQIQKQAKSSSKSAGTTADAPTVSAKLAKLWFRDAS
jgi:hypothetical protein